MAFFQKGNAILYLFYVSLSLILLKLQTRMSNLQMTDRLSKVTEALTHPDSLKSFSGEHTHGEPVPSGHILREIIELCRAILFPGFYGTPVTNLRSMNYHTGVNIEKLYQLLIGQIRAGLCFADEEKQHSEKTDKSIEQKNKEHCSRAQELAVLFIERLPDLRAILYTDVEAAYNGDPAAESFGEIISCYPAIRALTNYRIAHELDLMRVPLIPRIITEMAHSETGIDIHPSAQIGHHFTIDHGTGVVIGATCIIGNYVKLYQGVTLGAKSFPLDENGNPIKGIPRHPILEDGVIVYSNATILGRITIGKGAVIGGNIWVTENVEPGARIVQKKYK